MSPIESPLTLDKLIKLRKILDEQRMPYGSSMMMAGDEDTEIVEFCGFKFVNKKQPDYSKFDVAKWAKRMGIRYLPKQDDSVWLT